MVSMMIVRSLAPAGTRCMSTGPVSPVVSQEIGLLCSTAQLAPAAGLVMVACARLMSPRANDVTVEKRMVEVERGRLVQKWLFRVGENIQSKICLKLDELPSRNECRMNYRNGR